MRGVTRSFIFINSSKTNKWVFFQMTPDPRPSLSLLKIAIEHDLNFVYFDDLNG